MASTMPRAFRKLAARSLSRAPSRPFSGGHGGAEEVEKWKKISIGATAVVVLMSLKEFVSSEHHHHEEGPQPDYMHIRNKPFPWTCSDCSLFDTDCFEKCKGEHVEEHGH